MRLVAVHSFTPRKRISDGDRPWLLGLLHGPDVRLAKALAVALGAETARAINLDLQRPVYRRSSVRLHFARARRAPGACRTYFSRSGRIRSPTRTGSERWTDLLAEAFLRITDEMIGAAAQHDADSLRIPL